MILRRVIAHVREQNWTAIAIDFVIVVTGVFVGLQVNLWNEARIEAHRRQQIVDALVTNLEDAVAVQQRFIAEIDTGLAAWEAASAGGAAPAPFYYRIQGSDTAPDVWSTFEQMGLTDLFDPVTLFDLTFFYSERDGLGRKYVRYVTFVESEVLPGLIQGSKAFYGADGRLLPAHQANMDRLREFRHDTERMTQWASCLVHRLRADRTFASSCGRANFQLPGMADAPRAGLPRRQT